jgi:16S rRNA processing protein RimM
VVKSNSDKNIPQDRLRVGRLTKPHGLKGAIKLELFTDNPEVRFAPGSTFSVQVPDDSPWFGKTITIRELKWFNEHPVGFFEEIADRTAAESIVKAILWIDQSEAESLVEPDAWYGHQLAGLSVRRDGQEIGTVTEVQHFPAQDILVVKTPRGEVLVPFVSAIVPEVNIEERFISVTPPLGLFETFDDDNAQDVANAH